MKTSKSIWIVGMVLSLLTVIQIEGYRFNFFRLQHLDYEESCDMKSFRKHCISFFGLICDPWERKCLCRPGEILQEPCQYNIYYGRECWRQCVGKPGQKCSRDYRIEGTVNEYYCVEGAHCIRVTDSSRKPYVTSNMCVCNRGFNISDDGTRCIPVIMSGRSASLNASRSVQAIQARSKCWILYATWKISLTLWIICFASL